MIKCLDLLSLGHKKFPVKMAASVLPRGWGAGAFVDVFGPPFLNTEEFIAEAKPSLFRFQLHWDAAHSSKEAIIPLKKLEKFLPRCEALANAYSKTKFYVSHTCEYNCRRRPKLQARMDMCKALAPSCVPVQSYYKGIFLDGYTMEYHGNIFVDRGDIVSLDGTDFRDVNMSRWIRNNRLAIAAFGWRSEFNLRRKGQKKPPLPPNRPMILTKPHIEQVIVSMK